MKQYNCNHSKITIIKQIKQYNFFVLENRGPKINIFRSTFIGQPYS